MTNRILDYAKFFLLDEFDASSSTSLSFIAENAIYDLEQQGAGTILSECRMTLRSVSDSTQFIRLYLDNIVEDIILNGKQTYTADIKDSDASNPLIGLANDDDGTNADTNIIATNVSELPSTIFEKDSTLVLAVGSGEYNELVNEFTATTTTETVIAGEIIDSTSSNLFVSIHTDGKYYKYHNVNYPNVQGVILSGQTIALDSSFTLYNLKAITSGWAGLGNSWVYADNGGIATTTTSSTTTLAGIARDDIQLVHAERMPAGDEMSQVQAEDDTDTNFSLVSGERIGQAIEANTSITQNTSTDISGNSWVLDEDDMTSDDDTKVPTQQSVRAYVANSTSASAVSAEAITTGDALCIPTGSQLAQVSSSGDTNFGRTTEQKRGQEFLCPGYGATLNTVVLSLKKVNLPTNDLLVRIYESDKSTLLGTSANVAGSGLTTSFADITFTFSGGVTLTPGTTYFMEVDVSSYDSTNYFKAEDDSSDPYTNGDEWAFQSVSWAEMTGLDLYFKFDFASSSNITKTNASDTNLLDFIGYAQNTVALGEQVKIKGAGFDENDSSMTAGDTLYLSDTAGTTQNSAGTNSVKVGKAISATVKSIILLPL